MVIEKFLFALLMLPLFLLLPIRWQFFAGIPLLFLFPDKQFLLFLLFVLKISPAPSVLLIYFLSLLRF